MKIENLTSLAIVDLREKAINLIEEFEIKNGIDINDYNKKLERFLKRRIGKYTDKILITQILISINSLKIPNSNI